MGPHQVQPGFRLAQLAEGPQHLGQILVGIVAAEHEKKRIALQVQGAQTARIKAQSDRHQPPDRHPQAPMHLPGGGFGVAQHPHRPVQHQRHIAQVIGEQGGGLGEAQRQQVMGQHHRAHAPQQGGLRQRREQQRVAVLPQDFGQLVLGPEQAPQVALAAVGWREVGRDRNAVRPSGQGAALLWFPFLGPGIGFWDQQGHQLGVEGCDQIPGHHADPCGLGPQIAAVEQGQGVAATHGLVFIGRIGSARAVARPRSTARLCRGLSGSLARDVASRRKPRSHRTQAGVWRCRKRQ